MYKEIGGTGALESNLAHSFENYNSTRGSKSFLSWKSVLNLLMLPFLLLLIQLLNMSDETSKTVVSAPPPYYTIRTKEANLAVVSSTTSVKEWWLAQFPGIGSICAKP